ncbi:protein-L-isoaspartate O-methyltransferase family protein [Methylobacterium organophilum]|uniref:Protein-L-isoaspartate O-methyltransferase n=1 Tax=Methylobacterium organophilum TaxID=410 RepID=A0ABQ4T4X6_METOR|nr:methyltransferase domain-containing protein [Methylobacterium organophilum]GJE26712.1 Protein-L-isoaspartate O-methyltransferase [Methylobacterium organophilum]
MPEGDEDLTEAVGNAAFVLSLRERGLRDTAVLRAMEQVPREGFAPAPLRSHARRDIALPLACGQTMTAPRQVGAMLAALALTPGARVLEVGTGSGYVTALLARLGAGQLHSLDRYATLTRAARDNLHAAGIRNAVLETADGLADGVAGEGRYDRILVNGLLAALPAGLTAALTPGGRLVCALPGPEGGRLAIIGPDGATQSGASLRLPPLTPGRARMS